MTLTTKQKTFLDILITIGKELGDEEGRVVTGELSACKILGMEWKPSTGYDCIDAKDKKVQIKTRRDSRGGKVNPVREQVL